MGVTAEEHLRVELAAGALETDLKKRVNELRGALRALPYAVASAPQNAGGKRGAPCGPRCRGAHGPDDLAELVMAARAEAFEPDRVAERGRLDAASEAFAECFGWDNDPGDANGAIAPAPQERRPLRVIGFAGPQDSGKDTAADVLVADHGWVKINVGEPIYAMAAALLRADGRLRESEIDWLIHNHDGRSVRLGGAFGDATTRQLMRTLGDDWGRGMVHPDLYAGLMAGRLAKLLEGGAPGVAVTGVRKANEAAVIREFGGEVWLLERPGFAASGVHSSETGFEALEAERTIPNDRDVGALQQLVRDAFRWVAFIAALSSDDEGADLCGDGPLEVQEPVRVDIHGGQREPRAADARGVCIPVGRVS